MTGWVRVAVGGFEIERTVNVPVHAVRALFADTERWVRMQPLVTSITPEAERPGHYRIHERVRVLGMRIPNGYRARIEPGEDGVESEAWSRPAIHLDNRIRWTERGGGTHIVESVRVEAPRLLLSFTVATARKAHAAMLDRICDALIERADGRDR